MSDEGVGDVEAPARPRATPQLSTTLVTFDDAPLDWPRLVAVAEAADRAGIDRLLVSDHIAFGESLDDYGRPELGGVAGGRQPTGPDGNWLEPLTVLSAVAARTQRVRLGTNILLAALRRPAVLAKTLATLDFISGGRVDVGVGIGWQRAEYEAAGVPFAERGRRLDHTLAVLHTLWREQSADFSDDQVAFRRIHAMPKPVQPGGVPVWIGGSANARVARRIARFGSGWIPWGDAARDLAAAIEQMRELVAVQGGDCQGLQIAASLKRVRGVDGQIDLAATMAPVTELVSVGVTDFRLGFPVVDDVNETEARFRAAVDAFRAVTAPG